MIRKGQVLHGVGVTGRWQVRHCQKMKKKSTRKGQSQTIMFSWWSSVRLLSTTLSWWETWGVMTLCCFWKYIPACQRKIQPAGSDGWWWWDPIMAPSLEPFRCEITPVPLQSWSGLSHWLLPVWTCLWMTTSSLPTCVFSLNETQRQIVDENVHLCGVTIWCAGRGKQDTAV